MDFDFGLLIYIAFIIIALVSRLRKKRNQLPPPDTVQEASPEKDTVSFEDLLREFTGGQQTKPAPAAAPVKEYVPEPRKEREYEFQSRVPNEREIAQVYDETVKEAGSKPRGSTRPSFGHFKEFDQQEDVNPVIEELRETLLEPESAAKAIILSEIINRKYT